MANPELLEDGPPQWPLHLTNGVSPDAPGANLTTHDVQAAVEGAVQLDDSNSIEFLGKRFRLSEQIGLMPLLAFANASKRGLDSDSMEGLAAMYVLIRDCVDQTRAPATDEDDKPIFEDDGTPRFAGPSEFMRFEAHCYETKADGEDLMDFIGKAVAVVSARPRLRRETSSGGSPQTSPKSKATSSFRDTWPGSEELTDVRQLGR